MKFKSIEDAKRYLTAYRDSIPDKSKELIEKLADRGIMVANLTASMGGTYGSHEMHKRVEFLVKDLDVNKYGAKALLVGQGQPFISVWQNGEKSATVFPMHMLEFGTGLYFDYERADDIASALQGNKVASTEWFFIDENGHIKLGTAIAPTSPLYYAWQQMVQDYVSVAREVWKS